MARILSGIFVILFFLVFLAGEYIWPLFSLATHHNAEKSSVQVVKKQGGDKILKLNPREIMMNGRCFDIVSENSLEIYIVSDQVEDQILKNISRPYKRDKQTRHREDTIKLKWVNRTHQLIPCCVNEDSICHFSDSTVLKGFYNVHLRPPMAS